MDDIGNWGEPLGVVSLVVEGALLALATACFLHAYRQASSPDRAYPAAEVGAVPPQRAAAATDAPVSR